MDPTAIDPAQLKEMDCITCHNRITHLVNSAGRCGRQLDGDGISPTDIPEIRSKAVEVYSQRVLPRVEMGLNGIAGLESYYQTYHPDYYAANKDQDRPGDHRFARSLPPQRLPRAKVDWTTHPEQRRSQGLAWLLPLP